MSREKIQGEDLINSVFCAEGQNRFRLFSPPFSTGVWRDALVLIDGGRAELAKR
jgi:hypothetical protein